MHTRLGLILSLVGCSPPPAPATDGRAIDLDLRDASPAPDLTRPLAATGAACARATDCAGARPTCITRDPQGNTWPDGYCTSQCNPARNDPQSGLNDGCPGDGTCAGQGTTGTCLVACTAMDGPAPCPRMGYSCFVPGCQPTSLSQCDPTVKGSCNDPAKACVPVGADPVGECVDACDPFAQDCAMLNGSARGCYATHRFGEGICSTPAGGGADGAACRFLNSCDPGFGCRPEGQGAACRPYCRAAGGMLPEVPCATMGRTCRDLSPMTRATVVGLCAP